MFNPENLEAILGLEAGDLAALPNSEDDRYEYKSGSTKDYELADKIGRAASGFWNSGGGLFVAGVNGSGQPDGGVALTVGRQSRRDWIDQTISRVTPHAKYVVKCLDGHGAGLNITSGNAVVLIGFAASEDGPHMAPDNRYYLRAGAHTVPASHFLVEAIHARRGLRSPILRHIVRRKPEGGGVLQIGIICLNDAPALNTEVNFEPVPKWLNQFGATLPLLIPVISREAAFYFDFHLMTLDEEPWSPFQVKLKYHDLADRIHVAELTVDVEKQLGPNFGTGDELRNLQRAIEKVADVIKNKRDVEKAVEKVADAIKSKR